MPQDTAQSTKRKWLLFMIFAPGIFFIFYWASLRYNTPAADDVEMPKTYVELGERVLLDGNGYQVYQGIKLFSDRVELQNNLAIAEPGRVFVGLGLDADSGKFQGEIEVIDSLGSLYAPLDVERDVVARTFGFANNADDLFIFKVSSKAENFYFLVKNQGQAWRFDNTYRE